MRRLLKWVFRLVAVVIVAVAALVAYVYVASSRAMSRSYQIQVPAVPIPSSPEAVVRGRYLAEKVALCTDCHGPDLGGRVVVDSPVMGRLVAANLTRGRGGLPADYADRDFVRAITHGVKRDGRSVIFMPSGDYTFTAEDLGAIIAYVKSMPTVDRALPAMAVGPLARALGTFADFPLAAATKIDHTRERLAPRPDLSNATAAGDYLVSTAGCRGCHGATLAGGAGPPPGASNITPVGIGDWSERDFFAALREHRRPNGTTINEAMPKAYGEMSDEDLRLIFSYLRTVPRQGEKTASQQQAR